MLLLEEMKKPALGGLLWNDFDAGMNQGMSGQCLLLLLMFDVAGNTLRLLSQCSPQTILLCSGTM